MSDKVIADLCLEFEKKLRVPVEPEKYNEALDEIFMNDIEGIENIGSKQVETVLSRAYQAHSSSRVYLHELILKDIPKSLNLFESLSIQTVHILIGSFETANDTIPLIKELKDRIHYGEDTHPKYLLSCIVQSLNKYSYAWDQIEFIVRDVCLRMGEPDFKSIGLIIFTLLQESFEEQFYKKFTNIIDSLILEAEADVGNDPLSLIVEIFTELYPALTNICSELFLGSELDKLFKEKAMHNNEDEFIKKLLKLLSVACIDENVRNFIAENYLDMLERSLKLEQFKTYSAVVLIKTWSFTKLKGVTIGDLGTTLTDNFLMNLKIDDGQSLNDECVMCIEGLAYLTLKKQMKMTLRYHEEFSTTIINLLKKQDTPVDDSVKYGILVILGNISTYPMDVTMDGAMDPQALQDLKTYSELKSPKKRDANDVIENNEDVTRYIQKYILKTELLSYLRTKLAEVSPGSRQQIIRIIYNLTRARENISASVEQGCVVTVIEYLANKKDKKEPTRLLALRSLTKMLTLSDPKLIFNKYSRLTAIPFLYELLQTPSLSAENPLSTDELITTQDSYEALCALTNLASTEDSNADDVCKQVVTDVNYWSIIENLILDDNILVQRATLELIANLMCYPLSIAAKIFNFENPQSLRNFNILVKLLELNDVAAQRAVAAIFANISSSVPLIAQTLLDKKELIEKATGIFAEQIDDEALRQRLFVFFFSLFELLPSKEEDSRKFDSLTRNTNLKMTLESLMKRDDIEPEYLEAIPAMLSKFYVK
ncbi:hypothetical protein NCAS_0G00750 [Naumovozyma castellii]|uniref:UNC-45/Cro1/She4 central domain-containing protein n=1 Tax=Naumovozyma castellii TaxID=27288 RepID=G0VHS8_NAUCA|nr:hypothetical protein NCAS_0G00750 [Naumovozyma castellii CBS 4309]CCC70962.1 hypothetical protein NCAS_0G00750 [Naumovozyma castellii CBS 4309]